MTSLKLAFRSALANEANANFKLEITTTTTLTQLRELLRNRGITGGKLIHGGKVWSTETSDAISRITSLLGHVSIVKKCPIFSWTRKVF